MFMKSMFQNQTSDKLPTGPQQPEWFSSMFGRNARSGVQVTADRAMQLGTLRACVTLLAESVAQLPCILYKRDGDQRTEAVDHPLFRLLTVQPNQKDTSFEYFEFAQGHLGIGGDHYAMIKRNENAEMEQIIPLHPDNVQVRKGSDGMPYYYLKEHDEVLSSRFIHHVKCFSENGYTGLSPIEANTDVLGLALAVEEHASGTFSNGTSMSGVIEGPAGKAIIDSQTKVESFLSKFQERHSGLGKFSIAMLQQGLTYKQMSMDNEKAQLLESRRMSVEEICRLYRIPRHMVQDDSKTNFNTVEQLSINFVIYTLLPWLKRHEAAMMRDFLLPSEQSEYYIQFDVSSLLRGDLKSRYESYAIGRQWGWLSVNDIRRLENLQPIIGGGKYLTPLNMVDSSQIEQTYKSGLVDVDQQQIQEIQAICRR